jgi:hypothetical protein
MADVVVLSNATQSTVTYSTVVDGKSVKARKLFAGDVIPLSVEKSASVSFAEGDGERLIETDLNQAYAFSSTSDGSLTLKQLELGDESKGRVRPAPLPLPDTGEAGVIRVHLVTDAIAEAERDAFEQQLDRRLRAASFVLSKHCRMRLEVVSRGTWRPDPRVADFNKVLREFETTVDRGEAHVAIGFTRRHAVTAGRNHLGGTRGPLHSHILIREMPGRIRESDRVEVLVHEVGHFLGATHWPDESAVMRPTLGKPRAAGASFKVVFDPMNTLVMSLVTEEMRRANVKHVTELSPGVKRRLRDIYSAISKTLPGDKDSKKFVELIDRATVWSVLVRSQKIHDVVLSALAENLKKEDAALVGDELFNHVVQVAATAASKLDGEEAPTALCLGLALALSDVAGEQVNCPQRVRNLLKVVDDEKRLETRKQLLGNSVFQHRSEQLMPFAEGLGYAAVGEAVPTVNDESSLPRKSGGLVGVSIIRRQPDLSEIGKTFDVKLLMPTRN